MKCNVGGMDRGVRIVVGAALIAFAYFSKQPMAYLAYIGVIPLVTGLLGVCPLYSVCKFSSSCEKDEKGSKKD